MTNKIFKKITTALRAGARFVLAVITSQHTWLLALALSAAALVSVGVYILCGLGWALIAAGAFSMFFAAIIFKGITNG